MTTTPPQDTAPRAVEDALAAALYEAGTRIAFGVPGGGANLDMVGALGRAGITFVLTHGESAACMMAAAYGHLTDSVGVAVATRGPGAAAAVNGAAQATLDRHPLILVTDATSTTTRARITHQLIDQVAMLGPVTKMSAALHPGAIALAVDTARAWPPGCVHFDQDPTAANPILDRSEPAMPSGDRDAVRTAVATSSFPLVIVGSGAGPHSPEIRRALERLGVPVLTTYQGAGLMGATSPQFGGPFTNGAAERPLIEQADLIVLVGVDMVEPIAAPWPYEAPVMALSRTSTQSSYAPIDHEVVGHLPDLVEYCMIGEHGWPADAGARHLESVRRRMRDHGHDSFGPIELVDTAAAWAARRNDITVTVDAGAHFLAVMPIWPVPAARRLLISNGLATMGYAVPAAIGAALARPGTRVVALTGDGGMGMVLSELETMARLDLPITVIVFDDASLSLIQAKQGPDHGGDAAVRYGPISFADVARAHGVAGVTVSSANDLEQALTTAPHGPMVIDAHIDPAAYPHLLEITRG